MIGGTLHTCPDGDSPLSPSTGQNVTLQFRYAVLTVLLTIQLYYLSSQSLPHLRHLLLLGTLLLLQLYSASSTDTSAA